MEEKQLKNLHFLEDFLNEKWHYKTKLAHKQSWAIINFYSTNTAKSKYQHSQHDHQFRQHHFR